MNPIKKAAGKAQRSLFRLSTRVGLVLQLRRATSYSVAGLQISWKKDSVNITRGLIAEHVISGVPVRFFVNDENDLVQQLHLMGRYFDSHELDAIARHYEGGTFVDVGANVGNHTLYAALVLGIKNIICFEPNPVAYRLLQYNVLLNGLAERCELRQEGLFNETVAASIIRSPERNLGATRVAGDAAGSLKLVRGDDALHGTVVGFLKIDVEALELSVLEGLKNTIAASQPIMLVEVDDSNQKAFLKMLADFHYEVCERMPSNGNSNYIIKPITPSPTK